MEESLKPDILHYFPEHIKEIPEFQAIAKADDRELKLIWDALDAYQSNISISTMDENQCSYYERILKITALDTDTLVERRDRIKGLLNSNLPYTEKKFREILDGLLGEGKYILEVTPSKYTLSLGLKLASARYLEYVNELVEKIVPANLIRKVFIQYNIWKSFKSRTWNDMTKYTWNTVLSDQKFQS
jgi:hypothetical protein